MECCAPDSLCFLCIAFVTARAAASKSAFSFAGLADFSGVCRRSCRSELGCCAFRKVCSAISCAPCGARRLPSGPPTPGSGGGVKCTFFSASAALLLAFDCAARRPSCESWNFTSPSCCRVNRFFFATASGGDGFVTGICRPLSAALALTAEGKHARCQESKNARALRALQQLSHQHQVLTTHLGVSCPDHDTWPQAVEIAQTSPSQRYESHAHLLNLRQPVLQPSLPVRTTRILGNENGDQQ